MASWYSCRTNESLEREESDILNPEEFQHVLEYEPPVLNETKIYCQPSLPSADSTFVNNTNSTSTGPLPAREDYPGPFAFSVLLDGVESTKNKWTYSTMLNKLYIVWDKIIPIQFKWIPSEPNFVVRALPVYTDAQDMKLAVKRCLIHLNASDPTNEGFEHVKHVIRSDNPGVYYEENQESERCSVVVPLGELQPGTGTVTVTYKFMCKTTCVTGMMRRPITVLFTLERPNGEVVGRQKLNVKICSCPKRDMQKDESSANEKQEEGRKRPLALASTSKRMKTEDEEEEFHLDMVIENKDTYKCILESMHAAILRIMRMTQKTHSSYSELTKLLRDVETRLSRLIDS
ncbi:Cellular tumor antigen p53, putative [Pediculus humanus corporis]|uniref:Cellular tumor antigen p53, putative n=1 Tax=Pediculus humanus subsp. corporis TaxID=121224 RepID=E0V916_PEDHC|nr:Cellular tumor antigen p53, putative [Pediculus humanus corporis]EEB09872.1 Cellular tumor antigen p53, putative [Pediculus humanus corporis]